MSNEFLQKIVSPILSASIILASTAIGQMVYMYFTVKQNNKEIYELSETVDENRKNTITVKDFARYIELAEQRQAYLEKSLDSRKEADQELLKKIEKLDEEMREELSKMRSAIGFRYRDETGMLNEFKNLNYEQPDKRYELFTGGRETNVLQHRN